jgi:iron-sulfur cluster assembly protein
MTANIRPITISHRACQEIHRIRQTKGIPPDYGLRVGVRGGGCAGVSHMIGFDKKKETEHSRTVDGVAVYVDKKHAMYLFGKEVDFVDDAEGKGFTFVNNPGASS